MMNPQIQCDGTRTKHQSPDYQLQEKKRMGARVLGSVPLSATRFQSPSIVPLPVLADAPCSMTEQSVVSVVAFFCLSICSCLFLSR